MVDGTGHRYRRRAGGHKEQRLCGHSLFHTETKSAKEQRGPESSDEDEWWLQELDISIEEELGVTEDSKSAAWHSFFQW